MLIYLYAVSEREEEARRRLRERELDANIRDRYSPYMRIRTLAWLGDLDGAFEELEASFETRDPYLVWTKVDPALAPLREDPRLEDLLHRMNLND